MSQDTRGPTGVARRRRRISDAETQRRMLDAAIAMVNDAGLTVSLDHISFEDVIRDAGVARSAVYRRWPYKDLFFSDLLKELAKGASPDLLGDGDHALDQIRAILLDRLDWLRTPGRQRALAAEALRQGALQEFENFHRSTQWRTYFALQATFLGLPDGDLRTEVRAALTASEGSLAGRVAGAYEYATRLLGLRPRPDVEVGYTTVATLATATIRGLVLMAPTTPSVITRRFTANPFGAPEPAQWSEPALAMASVVLNLVEPDPDITWDDAHLEAVRTELESGTLPDFGA